MYKNFRLGQAAILAVVLSTIGNLAASRAQVVIESSGNVSIGVGLPPGATSDFKVTGSTSIQKDLDVVGKITAGAVGAPSGLTVNGPTTLNGSTSVIGGLFKVTDSASIQKDLGVVGHITAGRLSAGDVDVNKFTAKGLVNIEQNLYVEKNIYVDGAVHAEEIIGFGTVPVGAIIDYFPPPSNNKLPDNFVICDGSEITVTGSPFDGQKSPDLRDMFARGAYNATSVGRVGGADSENVTVKVVMPSETGGITSAAPSGIVGGNDAVLGLIRERSPATSWRFSLVDQKDNAKPWWNDGNHVHSIKQPDPVVVNVKTVPKYVSLLKIMRVK